MHYIDQYLRDIYTLIKSRRLHGKLFMFFFYNYLCAKNILGKIFGIHWKTQKFKHFTIHFDSFNAFFAIFTEMFIYNIYYFETTKNQPIIIDCGGNIGMAVIYFKYLFPEAIIDCYEPDRDTFKYLEKNIAINHLKNVHLHNEAISGEKGEVEFYSQGDMIGGPGNSLEKTQATFEKLNTYTVPVTTISSRNDEYIDFLKIDIEGSEGKMFEDIKKHNILGKVNRISLEYHYDRQISNNKLSDILKIFEDANMEYVININTLVTIYVDEHEMKTWSDRYVLVIDAYHKNELA